MPLPIRAVRRTHTQASYGKNPFRWDRSADPVPPRRRGDHVDSIAFRFRFLFRLCAASVALWTDALADARDTKHCWTAAAAAASLRSDLPRGNGRMRDSHAACPHGRCSSTALQCVRACLPCGFSWVRYYLPDHFSHAQSSYHDTI